MPHFALWAATAETVSGSDCAKGLLVKRRGCKRRRTWSSSF